MQDLYKKKLSQLVLLILELPRFMKVFLVLVTDLALCVISAWLAYYLRIGEFIPLWGNASWTAVGSLAIAIPIFIFFGLYRAIFRYAGWPALVAVARAMMLYAMLYASVFTVVGVAGVPRTVGIIQPVLLFLFVAASRASANRLLGSHYLNQASKLPPTKVIIYGAGNTGRLLLSALAGSTEMRVEGFLDDDPSLRGFVLNGISIFSPTDLQKLIDSRGVDIVLLAMPNLNRNRRNGIIERIQKFRVAVRTLPNVIDLAKGEVSVADLRDLDIDDLLGRDRVNPDYALLAVNILNKVVMVSGAGGSIGGELCRQILSVGPSKLVLIEQSEFALYNILQELQSIVIGKNSVVIPVLASVRDVEKIRNIFSNFKPDTVYHAAAYKHVPLVELNPAEGIRNNVFGTLSMIRAAEEQRVSNFVLISTDKAVRPTNVMGASKRLAEMLLQSRAANNSATKFCLVRFGNVLDSSGSVVPLFREQIRRGGPITLTHEDITRFFMTIPEAAELVIQAGAMAEGGDVFVLDMGEPVKIFDLAIRMIELSGLTYRNEANPDGDIEIEITGLRPGEKLYEELLIGGDQTHTAHPLIMKAYDDFLPWGEFEGKLDELSSILNLGDVFLIKSFLSQIVNGYRPQSSPAQD